MLKANKRKRPPKAPENIRKYSIHSPPKLII
jgi:hypothetical protein